MVGRQKQISRTWTTCAAGTLFPSMLTQPATATQPTAARNRSWRWRKLAVSSSLATAPLLTSPRRTNGSRCVSLLIRVCFTGKTIFTSVMSCVPRIMENVLRKGSWDYQRWFLTSNSEWGCVQTERKSQNDDKLKLWLNWLDRCAVAVVVIYKRVGKTAECTNLQDNCVLPSCHQSNLQCWVDTFYDSKFVLFPEKCWFQSEYFPTPDWICLGMWLKRVWRISNCEVTFKCDEYVQDMRLR